MALVQEILATMEYGPAPEASDHVSAWLDQHEGCFGHFMQEIIAVTLNRGHKEGDSFWSVTLECFLVAVSFALSSRRV